MTNKHTPAPWKVRYCGQHWNNKELADLAIVYGNDTENICDTVYKIADANLISAAPELLEALEELMNRCPDDEDAPFDVIMDAHKAINKAKGIEE